MASSFIPNTGNSLSIKVPKVKGAKMSQLEDEFRKMRKVNTPWCVVRTTDYRSTIKSLLTVRTVIVAKDDPDEDKPISFIWSCVDGVISPNGQASFATPDDAPFVVLKNALESMPAKAMLFMVIVDNSFWEVPYTIQAIANLRDEFKANNRMVVFLCQNPRIHPLLAEDIPILDDPLPTEITLKTMIQTMARENDISLAEERCEEAASMCLGMPYFPAEESVARNLSKKGIDLKGLSLARQSMIESASDRALVFERENWTFDMIGGQDPFKEFIGSLFKGPKKPRVVVRVDEIDKSITAASAGAVADNTGTSQDILKTLLTALEDNKWMGLLAVGGPGTGKTLASICIGNQFEARTLSLDLGAVKGSLVGETEGKIRRVVQILRSIGGENVFFMATANRLDTMPPELQRRFWLGTWFWDLPTPKEKIQIWRIQRTRFKISEKDTQPLDDDWTGSDIRNCCQMSWVCDVSLVKASKYITLAGKASKLQIDQLRDLATRSDFKSVSTGESYRRPDKEKLLRKVGNN